MKKNYLVAAVAILFCYLSAGEAAAMNSSTETVVKIRHTKSEIEITELDNKVWASAMPVTVDKYWSGGDAPRGRQFTARLLWSNTGLYVRFEAVQTEPLVVSEKPDLTKKIRGLWDRDVCEIFIAPDSSRRNKYFEFEIAPTGEWIDLGIEVTSKERLTDWAYRSNMTSAARIDSDNVVMAIKIPFAALGKTPKKGDVWLGNLFRCVGKDPTRGYLAWQPTKTKEPAFHVPKAFGEFEFVK